MNRVFPQEPNLPVPHKERSQSA